VSRYLVVAALFVLSLITYIDRAAISSVKDPLASELALTDQAMGAVFSAFALGYALAQIPAGWLADKVGPRLMLSAVVAIWSVLTAVTGSVSTFWSLLAVRFLFGVAEAGAFPGSARVFYNWLPSSERGRANGIIFSASRLGAAVAFPIMAWLLANWNWRTAFWLLGIPGLIWAVGWLAWFRNEPETPPDREEHTTERLSFGQVFRSQPMLLAMLQYFAVNFTTFLCLSWMHPYLKDRYSLDPGKAALYTMLVLLFAATAQWVTGFLVDRLYVSKWRPWSRGLPAVLGFALSAIGVAFVPAAASAEAAVFLFTIAAFGAEMTISPSWAYCIDLGGRRSGALTGSMNMAGNLGSFVSANAFPFFQRFTGDASGYFMTVAALNIVAALCWIRMVALRRAGSGIRSTASAAR
jgi:ACS family glucarate transporter-like MFS transporter